MSPARSDAAAILADLNGPQQEAVTHIDGPLLVLAGPGSGKTRVITRRAAYLVHSGVAPHNVVAITFTNKAAGEMRDRIEALGVRRGMWVYTFHALGVRLLREFGTLARVEPGFSIYDETDSLRLVKEAMEATGISDTALRPEFVRTKLSDAKNRLLTPAACSEQADWYQDRNVAHVYEVYEKLLQQRNAVDFDDLLMRVAVVLRDHPDITERLNVRFRYVLIDEYQDTNHAQYLIAALLSRHHRNICATGDPDQSIYGWRGADLRNILDFERDYPDARVVRLEQNYRSTGSILRLASQLIEKNHHRKHKDLWSELGPGAPVQAWAFASGSDEANHIAQRIVQLHANGRPWSDFAIFYRVNALSRGLEESLRHHGIPYRIARGVEFYNRKEIRDTLAYLRLIVNPADDNACLRIINTPTRGIGKTTVERLRLHAAESGAPLLAAARDAHTVGSLRKAAKRLAAFADLIDRLGAAHKMGVADAVSYVLSESGLEEDLKTNRDEHGEDRLANVEELVTAATRYESDVEEPSLADFLTRVALTSDQDAVDEGAGVVLLLTLHAAKGLEFPVVFLVGMEQGLLPHERVLREGDDVEEERRLCFVGITRAKALLHLSHARERIIRGQPQPRPKSQFLVELADGGLEHHDLRPKWVTRSSVSNQPDGFVPMVDDLPPEEAARLVPRRGLRQRAEQDDLSFPPPTEDAPERPPCDAPGPQFVPDEDAAPPRPMRHRRRETPATPEPPVSPAYADWKPGMLVEHDKYGPGQIVWIRPGPGQTRAAIKFAGLGEKTMVLEFSPIRRLDRK